MKSRLVGLVLGALLAVSACGTDPGEQKITACTQHSDCEAGHYCGADNKCAQDCDPGAANSCPAGEVCDALGRCIVQGECVTDDDCDSPPAAPQCEGDTLVGYSQVGTCEQEGAESVCKYAESRTPCENGCAAANCIPDPCDQIACTNAPPPTCEADGTTRTEYAPGGVCVSGVCDFAETSMSCAAGCLNGQCQMGACEVETCNTPPANTCDDNVAINYSPTGTCDDSSGSPVCDYDAQFEGCSYTKSTCNSARCENPVAQVGPIVIVEYLANPAGSFNDLAEWFEVVNTGAVDVDMNGWVIRSGTATSEQSHTIAGIAPISPGGRFVFSRIDTVPFAFDYDYPSTQIELSNNTDWLQLELPTGEVSDYVYYEAGSILAGRSRKLNPQVAPDPNANDNFANWCPSMGDEFLQNPSNWGTPGAPNTDCAADPCTGFQCVKPQGFCLFSDNKAVQYVENQAMCQTTRLNNPFCYFPTIEEQCSDDQLCAFGNCEDIPANLAKPGEVVISEYMPNPDGSDTDREWLEVYNASAAEVSLFSIQFRNESGASARNHLILDPAATIPAGGYIVFARDTDPGVNGGVNGALEFSAGSMVNTPDPGKKLILRYRDGTIVDEAYYGNLSDGASMQLDVNKLNATDNDLDTSWCIGASAYGEGGDGTPGAANIACP